jgi:hypothetical protein
LLRRRYRKTLILLFVLLVAAAVWLYWNRPRKVDMAAYVPADALAFVEVDDPATAANRMTETEGWRTLSGPSDAPARLIEDNWMVRLARWTGIGPSDAVVVARSQIAVFFTQAQATEAGNTLTIKPLAALVIETHTSQRRMRPAIEKYVAQFAQRAYGQPTVTRKQFDDIEFTEWSPPDNTRRIVLALVDTTAIIGNDETVVLSCLEVRRGRRRSLAEDSQLANARAQLGVASADVFAFVPKAGVKAAVQAWALSRGDNVADAASIAPIISNAFGNLIDAFALTTRFDNTGAEDRCRIFLSNGVSQRLATDLVPEPIGTKLDFSFAPASAISVTSYRFRSPASFWRELNAVVSSRADVLAAIAAKPLLRSLLEPYGVNDPDAFFAAIGPRLQLIRGDSGAPAVLIGETLDKLALRKLAEQRLGRNPKTENRDETEILVGSDGWSVAFTGNYFLSGPLEAVQHCLEAKTSGAALTSIPAFNRTQQSIDVSLPIIAVTISDDRAAAISFVELFSQRERSAFSANASTIQQVATNLRYGAAVTMLKDDSFEWTSRSSFGLVGSLFTTFAPERSR